MENGSTFYLKSKNSLIINFLSPNR